MARPALPAGQSGNAEGDPPTQRDASIFFAPGGASLSGKEIVSALLMQELRARGWAAHAVISGWNDGRYARFLNERRIPFTPLKLGVLHRARPRWTLDTLLALPGAVLALRHLAAELRPSVYVHTTLKNAAVVAVTLPASTLHVFHVHDVVTPEALDVISRISISRIAHCICVSRFVAAPLLQRNPATVSVVHNGVGEQPLSQRRSTVPRPMAPLIFAVVGQTIPRKRLDIVLRACGILAAKGNNFALSIYGDSSTDHALELKRLAAELNVCDKISWHGFQPQQVIYNAIDVLIAAGVDEPFGTTVLEAGAYGLPVIAVADGGFPEILRDGDNALLFGRDNAELLAAQIQRILDDRNLIARLGDRLRGNIRANLSMASFATNFEQAIAEARRQRHTLAGAKPTDGGHHD